MRPVAADKLGPGAGAEENGPADVVQTQPDGDGHVLQMHSDKGAADIHSGVGTRAYSFIWAMCGENQEFTDMDFIETKDLL